MSTGTAEWFLDVQGKKVGPYTAEEIAGLLHDKEIRADSRVTSDHLKGDWIEVRQLVSQMARASGGRFAPPPRPVTPPSALAQQSAVPTEPGQPPSSQPAHDPVRDLFDSLQAARDRTAQSKLNPGSSEAWSTGRRSKIDSRFPPQLILIMAIVIVLGGAVWGVTSMLKRTGESIQASSAAPGTKPAPPPPLRALPKPTIQPAPAPTKPPPKLFPTQRPGLRPALTPAPRAVPPPRPGEDWRYGSDSKSRDTRDVRDDRDERDERDEREERERREREELERREREDRERNDDRDLAPVDSWDEKRPPGFKPTRGDDGAFDPNDTRSNDPGRDDQRDSYGGPRD